MLMKLLQFFIFLLWVNFSFSQSQFEKGEIINPIKVKGAQNESFALYFPKSYTTEIPSSIVFIFDPSGRGVNGIKPFVSSAEKFNYILVCSNDSKNGSYQRNFDIVNRLFSHVFSEFNIDEKQIYTAGFSGGSRLASAIAVLTGSIQGVIACGAGFANVFEYRPQQDSKFSYVGLVGDEDMNYQEMLKAKLWLDKLNVDNELFVYEDGHRWPSSSQIERAFEWLQLQAYDRKLRKTNVRLVTEMYQQNIVIADAVSEKHPYESVVEYNRIQNSFRDYFNTDSIHNKIEVLQQSKLYAKEAKIIKEIADKEFKLSKKFQDKFREESTRGASLDYFVWWDRELKKLKTEIDKKSSEYLSKMLKRICFQIMATAFESSKAFEGMNRMDKVLYCHQLITHIYPEQAYWYFKLAETYAKANDAKHTRINLQKAIDNGFENTSLITNNPLFSKFKGHKKFDAFLISLND